MQKRILHIAKCDKFIPPFIDFVNENFDFTQHKFMINDGMAVNEISSYINVYLAKKTYFGQLEYYAKTIIKMHKSKKIILHGLFDRKIVVILFVMPWLLKKSYWVMWGADYLYPKKSNNIIKKRIVNASYFFVIRNVENLITYIPGSIDIVREKYHAKGHYHECLAYTSNIFTDSGSISSKNKDNYIRVLIGNSATPSNEHFEIFNKISPYMNERIILYVPLSYGDKKYANLVIQEGERLFGKSFIGLEEFFNYRDYNKFLKTIDIALFNHNRHQAMGNAINIIGMGKKIFMRSDIPSWNFFKKINVDVYDISDFDGFDLYHINENNKAIISRYFSLEKLIFQWRNIFND